MSCSHDPARGRWEPRGGDRQTCACQRFARNYATYNLAPPHAPTLGTAFHLGGCEVRCGAARRCEPLTHRWHARGQELYAFGASGHPERELQPRNTDRRRVATRAEVPSIRIALSLVPGTPHRWQSVVLCHIAIGQPPLVRCDRKGGERPWIERKRFAGLVTSPHSSAARAAVRSIAAIPMANSTSSSLLGPLP